MWWVWVVVAVGLIAGVAWAVRPRTPPPIGPSTPSAATQAEIDRLVTAGETIRAIKVLRTAVPRLGLAEAKARIDHWSPGGRVAPAASPDDGTASLPAEVVAAIDPLVARGETIRAIKVLRTHTDWSLKQAKERIDGWVIGHG